MRPRNQPHLAFFAVMSLILIAAFVMAGATKARAGGNEKPETDVTYVTTPNEYDDNNYAEIEINGRRCIVMTGYTYHGAGAGIDCDWSPR